MRIEPHRTKVYDVAVPNKTIYVSDGDLKLYQRAQQLAGGNLSAAIASALKRYVDVQEGLREGYDDVVVRVGVGAGRKVRFTASWSANGSTAATGVPPTTGSGGAAAASTSSTSSASPTGGPSTPRASRPVGAATWAIGDVRYGSAPEGVDPRGPRDPRRAPRQVPSELFDMVSRAARQPTVEELDI